MKREIRRACGHREVVTIYGPYKGREDALRREEEKVCTECFARAKAEDAARELVELEALFNLPSLEGSDKQIEWARRVRATRAKQALSFIKSRGVLVSEFLARDDVPLARALRVRSAKRWIESRKIPDLVDWVAFMLS